MNSKELKRLEKFFEGGESKAFEDAYKDLTESQKEEEEKRRREEEERRDNDPWLFVDLINKKKKR